MVVWPQIVMIVFLLWNLIAFLLGIYKHQIGIAKMIIAFVVFQTFILYAGGFWNVLLNGPVLGRLI